MIILSSTQLPNAKNRVPSLWPFAQFSSSNITTFYLNLTTRLNSIKSISLVKSIHAKWIKLGLHRRTFLANSLLHLYFKFGFIADSFQAFHDIPLKNTYSWNIMLGGCFKSGDHETPRHLFAQMPERDLVTWNSMISGFSSNGLAESALEMFKEMIRSGVGPNAFTFSILVSSVFSILHGKSIHGNLVRSGLSSFSNAVLGNSLINMYGKVGLADYAFAVFMTMNKLDTVSWNSIIAACDNFGYSDCAWDLFYSMKTFGFASDHFTMSTVMSICAKLGDLDKGKQVFAQCIKVGFLSNSIVLSATIDMFANCNRLDDSVRMFEQVPRWDSANCNSMISSYARHGYAGEALQLFVLTFKENIRPTEFTLGSVLNLSSCFMLADQGTHIHSLIVKLGLESDLVVASLLVDMYSKCGLIDSAVRIFVEVGIKDLVLWNTMIMGFARNGRGVDALQHFEELLESGMQPDGITLAGILLACGNVGLVNEGWRIFSSMKERYNVAPGVEHYIHMVDMLSRAGKLVEAMEIIETMPREPSASIWFVLLSACRIHGDVRLAHRVAERAIELEPRDPLPYMVLAQKYALMGMWDRVARVRKTMKEIGVKKVNGCSWIGLKDKIFVFKANQLVHYGGKDVYDMLRLLVWKLHEMGYFPQEFSVVGDGSEE